MIAATGGLAPISPLASPAARSADGADLAQNRLQRLAAGSTRTAALEPSDPNAEVKQVFQEFVAGTFYQQMLKSLRKMHGQPAYLHGGQGEQVFREHLDQEIASSLAKEHGGSLAEPLFDAFAAKQLGARLRAASAS